MLPGHFSASREWDIPRTPSLGSSGLLCTCMEVSHVCCSSLPDHFPHYPPTEPFPDLSAHVVPVLKVSHAEEEEGECCPCAFCSFYPLSVHCKPGADMYPGMPKGHGIVRQCCTHC